MRVSEEIEKLLKELDKQDELIFAEDADTRNHKVYQKISELSTKRDQLRADITAQTDETQKKPMLLELKKVNRDLDTLLNLLSKESMQL